METKKVVSTLVGTALVAGLLMLPAATFAQGANTPANPPAATQPGQQGQRMKHERHPEIRQAIRALGRAKTALQRGSKDFGGHRAQALQLVDQAIQQCQQALQSDK